MTFKNYHTEMVSLIYVLLILGFTSSNFEKIVESHKINVYGRGGIADWQLHEVQVSGALSLYNQSVDVAVFPAEKVKTLDIIYSNVSWNSKDSEPIFLPNLENLRIGHSQVNPNSIIVTHKLHELTIWESILIFGNVSDLLKSAVGLQVLELSNVSIDLISLPADSLQTLLMQRCTAVWTNDHAVVLKNLEEFYVYNVQINPHSIVFSDKLRKLFIRLSQLVGGNVYDILKTATKLDHLIISGVNDIDISKLPSRDTLTSLNLYSPKIHCSSQITFPNLERLELGQIPRLGDNTFCDINITFPVILKLDTSFGKPSSPNLVLPWLERPVQNLQFIFDLDPEVKSYQFGILIKLLLDNGLSEFIPEEYFLFPANFPKFRFQRLTIKKVYCDNGGYEINVTAEKYVPQWVSGDDGLQQIEMTKPLLQKVVTFMYFLFLVIFLFLGVFGNAISGYVLMRKKTSSGIILLSLTIYDSIIILTYAMSAYFNAQLFYTLFVKSDVQYDISEEDSQYLFKPVEHDWTTRRGWFLAFIIYPLNKTAYTGSVYSIILISVERFIAVCWPLKARPLLRSRNSKLSVFAVLVVSVVLNLPRWIESYEWDFYSKTSLSWNEYYKPMLMRMESYRVVYHGFVWTIAMYVLPFVLVGILNLKLGQQIIKARRIRGSLKNSSVNEEEASVTKMLLSVVVVFVVCNSIHIVIVFYFLLAYEQIELSTVEAISCLPLIVNSSVNFIIYIVMGRTLRAEFLKLVPNFILLCFFNSNRNNVREQIDNEQWRN